MYTFLIEVAIPGDSFWTLEKVRADSADEAKAELLASYGENAFFGHIKQTY
jgi:hypothetical protein